MSLARDTNSGKLSNREMW